jgi:hypothetical protein
VPSRELFPSVPVMVAMATSQPPVERQARLAGCYDVRLLIWSDRPAPRRGEPAQSAPTARAWHRSLARCRLLPAGIAGLQTISADVRPGGRREAILHSVGANAKHGWRRSNDDKRKAVLTLLRDPEWAEWSDREIARRCGVDGKMVAGLRPKPSAEEPQIRTKRKVKRKGKVYAQNTAGINEDRETVEDAEEFEDAAEPEYDSAAGLLRQRLSDTIERIDAWPSPADAMEAWMAGRHRGPPIEMVQRAVDLYPVLPLGDAE